MNYKNYLISMFFKLIAINLKICTYLLICLSCFLLAPNILIGLPMIIVMVQSAPNSTEILPKSLIVIGIISTIIIYLTIYLRVNSLSLLKSFILNTCFIAYITLLLTYNYIAIIIAPWVTTLCISMITYIVYDNYAHLRNYLKNKSDDVSSTTITSYDITLCIITLIPAALVIYYSDLIYHVLFKIYNYFK